MTAPSYCPPPGWHPGFFVDHLAAGWRLGDPEAFVAHVRPAIHPDVVSAQPMSPVRTGRAALEEQFRGIFRMLPGATAAIRSWGSAEPNVYIEFELTAPAPRRRFRLHTCDRFTLAGGLITERAVYFDPAPLLAFLARHPRRWPAALRAR